MTQSRLDRISPPQLTNVEGVSETDVPRTGPAVAESSTAAQPTSASDYIELIAGSGWESWDETPEVGPAQRREDYVASLRRAAQKSGADESVLTGAADLAGRRVALVVSEFGFLGGSIGAAAGARVTSAIRRATAEGLPIIALPASGGTRMQEGTSAFLQMVAIAAAVTDHRAAGLPYLVYLRHPTTGGVFASWGSLGHVTWAHPGALVGFLGPRVYAGLYGTDFPEGIQTAENLAAQSIIDAVVTPAELPGLLARTVALLTDDGAQPAGTDLPGVGISAPTIPSATPKGSSESEAGVDVWADVLATRSAGRRGLRELVADAGAVILSGTGPIWLALSRFGPYKALVIGQERGVQGQLGADQGRLIGPFDLRLARRGIRLAGELGLPLVTVIDTPGAELSAAAENDGLAGEIAGCTADLVTVGVPTVSVLLGQGGGGAALALFPADRRLASSDAWLSPLPPEGASLIVHRDIEHADEESRAQRIGARRLYDDGEIDLLVDWSSAAVEAGGSDLLIEAITSALRETSARRGPAADRVRTPKTTR